MTKIHTFPQDSFSYAAPSWKELDAGVFSIAQQVTADELSFDRVVTLAKGGWPLARTLIDYLDIPAFASMAVRSYTGINQRAELVLYQDLPTSIAGESILLFDDVADSGESLLFAKQYLEDQGAAMISTATVFYKPHSKIKPDYFAFQSNEWVIFPYELRETLAILLPKWESQGCDRATACERFIEMGFEAEMVAYLAKLI